MKKRYKLLVGFSALLVAGYFLGPKPRKPIYSEALPKIPELRDLDVYIKSIESEHQVKPGNEAEIIWADRGHEQTEYAIVYLHGFSALHF